jgi:endonuclease-8
VPEGDILRRTAAELDRALAGKMLLRAELRWPTVGGVDLVGRTVLGTAPYGKHLLTRLDDGWTLHTHLRMDGAWSVRRDDPATPVRDPKVRAVLATDGWLAVGRLLGMLDLVRTRDEQSVTGHLGPDLLADEFEAAGAQEALTRYAARGATPVAEVLLDQTVVAGIGTIFMAESLFVERIHPWLPADQVRAPRRLLLTARTLMAEAVRVGMPPQRVHMRERRPCVRCGTPVRRGEVREPPYQRPVYWCPRCQAAPAS